MQSDLLIEWIPRIELAKSTPSPLAQSVKPLPKYIHAPHEYKIHESLENLPLISQEAVIIEDLIYVLLGCEGSYVRFSDIYDPSIPVDSLKGPDFILNRHIPLSMKDTVKAIALISKHAIALNTFCDIHSNNIYGRVNQALCASIREFLYDYMIIVAQLENQLLGVSETRRFSLQIMQLELEPISHTLKQLYDLCQVIVAEDARKFEEAAKSDNSDFEEILASLKITEGANFADLGLTSRKKSGLCKGGTILRMLAERLQSLSGDPATKALLEKLLKEASSPYLEMLNMWLHKGVIFDPCEEFLIEEQKSIKKEQMSLDYTNEYWEKRYTVRKNDLPLMLSSPEVYERILLTGKYLNVVRECGGIDASKEHNHNYESIEDGKILITLASAYNHANETLLKLLIYTHKLPERVESLKHYFFLENADFLVNFMDIAKDELAKPSTKASKTTLQYLLDMSLRQPGSTSSADPYTDEVIVDITHTSVTENALKIVKVPGMDLEKALGLASSLTDSNPSTAKTEDASHSNSSKGPLPAILGIQLYFKIPFPLSLIISPIAILRYQLLFRHLVELKYIERLLENAWIEQQKSPVWTYYSVDYPELEKWKLRVTKLRFRMLIFIQKVYFYLTLEVIQSNWDQFSSTYLYNAKNADLLNLQHVSFLDRCMKECMLANEKLLRLQSKLYTACRLFAEYTIQRTRLLALIDSSMLSAKEVEEMNLGSKPTDKNGQELSDQDLIEWLHSSLSNYEMTFEHHLKILIEGLNHFAATETTTFLSLSSLLEVSLMDIKK